MRPHLPPQVIVTSIALIFILIAVGAGMLMRKHNLSHRSLSTAKTETTKSKTQPAAANSSAGSTPNSSASAATSTGQTDDASTTGPACELLTPDDAQQVLGPDAETSLPNDTSAFQTSHTTVSACAYSNSTGTVQLTVRTPSDSLGASKNATVFGSDKPRGATSVDGYGQAAYWDGDKHQLDVLGSNTWYIISRSTGTKADTVAVAKVLAGGF